jgi:hypothetical protein
MAEWAANLSQAARARFVCRRVQGHFLVPSESLIRDVLIRVDPAQLERALQNWNRQFAPHDASLAIDGKTMRNAIDDCGAQTHPDLRAPSAYRPGAASALATSQ